MDKESLIEYLALFGAASLAAVFKYFNEKQNAVSLLITQLLFGCFIAFIATPYMAEVFGMSYKGSLFFTWVLTYFMNNTLNAVFKMAFAKIDPAAAQPEQDDEHKKRENDYGKN